MSELVISGIDGATLQRLLERAAAHGRTAEAEASAILAEYLQARSMDPWARVNALREGLAASGRTFSDSTDLVREDRDR